MPGALEPIDDVAAKVAGRGIPEGCMELGKLGTGKQIYIPWMQATYVMVANKQALPYPAGGADINALTYDQLLHGPRPSPTRPASAGSASRPARRA